MSMRENLLSLHAAPGREEAVRTFIAGQMAAKGLEVNVDPIGNLYITCKGVSFAECERMLEAPMDESALLISGVTEEGFLRFLPVGSVDPGVLPASIVTVGEHPGVIGCKAVHHCTKEEREKPFDVEELTIDIGAENQNQAQEMVEVGQVAYFAQAIPAARYACALLTELAENLPADTALAFTVQGEVGHRGAAVSAARVSPRVVLSVACAEVGEGVKPGAGAVIPLADVGVVCDAALRERLIQIAKTRNLPVQTPAKIPGKTSAGAMQRAGGGATAAMVVLPCRYGNTPCAHVQKEDYETARLLLAAFLEEKA